VSAQSTMGIPIGTPVPVGGVTLGVSLAIPEPWGELLQRRREGFGDPLARAVPPHVTLLPPTDVTLGAVAGIEAHLAGVAGRLRPFPVTLAGTDTFRPVSPVVFVRVVSGGGCCDEVQRAVRTGPLARELSFPYHPHVTVAHRLDDATLDAAQAALAGFEAEFHAEAFVLYEHGDDEVWRPRRSFGFGAAAEPS
jgi:2'-5' RNA ligase